MPSGPILRRLPLGGSPWPTLDPFLFCAHHRDAYPRGNDQLGPDAALAGRAIGQDFADLDGWNMYHGSTVPGFPQHPHRGFETITFVRRGVVDHSDSLGATARFGRGDMQWLTAGRGIVHAEMFPLVEAEADNPLELFQLWLNLPAESKLVDPHFTMSWAEDTPVHQNDDGTARLTVITGAVGDQPAVAPPPASWAADPEHEVAVWHLDFGEGAALTLPPARHADVNRVLYLFGEGGAAVAGEVVAPPTGLVLDPTAEVEIEAGAATEALVLQGRPIGEPVAQYGPFVMNDRAGIEQAIRDYQSTGYGGWPWPSADPTHGRDRDRFARHADGQVESAPVA